MTNMSRYFMDQSLKHTSFDWDTDTPPDPSAVDELFQWLEHNAKTFEDLHPLPFTFAPNDLLVTFTDGSRTIIRTNLLNDYILLMDPGDGTPGYTAPNVQISRTFRAAYTYFNLALGLQKRLGRNPPN